MPVKIVQKEDKILREKAQEVALELIGTSKIQKVIKDMKIALASQDDGVAIAAPQIGVPLRIFVVSGKVINFAKGDEKIEVKYPDMIFINPKILKISKEKKYMDEGCLSVRYLYGKVKRSTKIQISAYDESGNFIKKGSSGLMAQIFQHEIDHLNGILFIDNAKNLEEITPEQLKTRSRSGN